MQQIIPLSNQHDFPISPDFPRSPWNKCYPLTSPRLNSIPVHFSLATRHNTATYKLKHLTLQQITLSTKQLHPSIHLQATLKLPLHYFHKLNPFCKKHLSLKINHHPYKSTTQNFEKSQIILTFHAISIVPRSPLSPAVITGPRYYYPRSAIYTARPNCRSLFPDERDWHRFCPCSFISRDRAEWKSQRWLEIRRGLVIAHRDFRGVWVIDADRLWTRNSAECARLPLARWICYESNERQSFWAAVLQSFFLPYVRCHPGCHVTRRLMQENELWRGLSKVESWFQWNND